VRSLRAASVAWLTFCGIAGYLHADRAPHSGAAIQIEKSQSPNGLLGLLVTGGATNAERKLPLWPLPGTIYVNPGVPGVGTLP